MQSRSLLFFFLCFAGPLFAQDQQVVVHMADGKPLESAAVYYQQADGSQSISITDVKGQAVVQIKGKTIIAIHASGYKPVTDTIYKIGAPLKYYLTTLARNLDQLVVTGQYETGTAREAIQQIKVIDRKRIEQQGAVNLRDVLTNELNVRLSQDNVLGSSLSIQGISGQNIKILMDGVPVIGRLDGNIDLNQINLNNIERIELIEGPMSVIYGTDALGGVLNLISKKPTKSTEVGLNGYYETVGTYNFDGRLAWRNPKGTAVSLTGGRNFFQGYSMEDTRKKQWKPREQYFGNAQIQFRIGKSTHRWQTDVFDEKLSDKGEPVITPYQAYAFDNYYYTLRITNSLQSDFRFKNNASLQLINSFSYYDRTKRTYRKDMVTGDQVITPNDGDQDTTNFTLDLFRGTYTTNRLNRKFNYQFGYDINNEKGKGDRLDGDQQQILDMALFASAEYKPISTLTIKPGLRISYNTRYGNTWVDDPEDTWITNVISYLPVINALNYIKFTPPVPSLNVKYNLNEKFTLRAAYARGFRAPSLKELSLFFVDVNHNIQGNPDLRAENSNNFNASVIYDLPYRKNFSLSIGNTWFYNDIRDQISLALVNAATQLYTYRNIDRFQTYGATLSVDARWKQISANVGFSQTARYNSLSDAYENVKPFSWSPEYRANLTYKVSRTQTDISIFAKYNGKVPGYAVDAQNNVYSTMIGAYTNLDATVTQPFWKRRILVTAGAKNIMNITNITYNAQGGAHSGSGGGMSMNYGRTYFVSLRLNLVKQPNI